MTRVLVVGGGISGLTLAWYLQRRGAEVTVLEAGAAPGGNIRTVERDGFLIDTGPTSTLLRGGALAEMIGELGLDAAVVEADRRARRYIVKHERLLPLPHDAAGFITTPLFGVSAKLRLFAEPLYRRAPHEESIAAFVRRRLGREILDWAVDPFVSGVYAGDPERLSVRAATARLYALEAEHGSLFVGAWRQMRRQRRTGAAPPAERLISFRRGMQTLPRALATALGTRLRLNALVLSVERVASEWVVRTADAEFRAPQLVLALPAYAAASLLAPWSPPAEHDLAAVAYPPVASVALGFAREQVTHALDGFGTLLPRRAGRDTLGVIFSSTLFPGRAPAGNVLLTGFIGGARNPAVAGYSVQLLADKVLEELRPLLGVRGEPRFRHVELWPRAIPQYELGHATRVARIDGALRRLPGLQLRANWRDGVSLADSVASAHALAGLLAPMN
jgi:protoporphyrinogen/coproporphyrinogen III oxidase